MSPRMHAHHEIGVVIGNNNPDPFPFDLPKIAPLSIWLSFFAQWIGHDEFGIRAAQLV